MGYRSTFQIDSIRDPMGRHLSYEEMCRAEEMLLAEVERVASQFCADALRHQYEIKWYEHEQDLAMVSEGIPYMFSIKIEGEDKDDRSILDVYDGKSYRRAAIITYPEFDITKLTSQSPPP